MRRHQKSGLVTVLTLSFYLRILNAKFREAEPLAEPPAEGVLHTLRPRRRTRLLRLLHKSVSFRAPRSRFHGLVAAHGRDVVLKHSGTTVSRFAALDRRNASFLPVARTIHINREQLPSCFRQEICA